MQSYDSDLGNFKLNRTKTLDKVRAKIKEIGIENITELTKETIKILRKNISKTDQEGEDMETIEARTEVEINESAQQEVEEIEKSEWLSPIEIEALMRAEDPAYLFQPQRYERKNQMAILSFSQRKNQDINCASATSLGT